MELTKKMAGIAQDMGLPFIHGTTEQLGVLVDTVRHPLVALVDYGSSTQDAHGCERVETVTINVFFLERVSPSFSPDETVAMYERCKMTADRFVDRIGGNDSPRFSTLGISGKVTYQRVNLRYKGMFGGIMVAARVTDFQGFAAPSSQFSPNGEESTQQ